MEMEVEESANKQEDTYTKDGSVDPPWPAGGSPRRLHYYKK